MYSLLEKVRKSPVLVRAVPFVIFVLFTAAQGKFFEHSQYWFYLAKVPLGLALIWFMRPLVQEMRWAFSWEAVLVGVAVFGMWVGLDPFFARVSRSCLDIIWWGLELVRLDQFFPKPLPGTPTWKPFDSFPDHPSLAWLLVGGRIFCSTVVVPPLEEIFYRSFLYRYVIRPDIETVPLNQFKAGAFAIAALIFGFAHFEWLSAILCAGAYHALIFRKNRMGDAMTAHAISNLLLGLWVVWKGAWNFW